MAERQAKGEDATVLHTIIRRFKETPDKLAYGWLSRHSEVKASCTYGDLDSRTQQIAGGLLSLIQERRCSGKTVVLCYTHGPEFILAFLGCLRAGLIPGELFL